MTARDLPEDCALQVDPRYTILLAGLEIADLAFDVGAHERPHVTEHRSDFLDDVKLTAVVAQNSMHEVREGL